MQKQLLAFTVLITFVQAILSLEINHAPIIAQSGHYEDYDAHPYYAFKYGVEDSHTGDYKSHEETRDGDTVKGQYSLKQPDGTILTVQYVADKHSGYNAVVHKSGQAAHPQYSHY